MKIDPAVELGGGFVVSHLFKSWGIQGFPFWFLEGPPERRQTLRPPEPFYLPHQGLR
jgi:hypothetical protein